VGTSPSGSAALTVTTAPVTTATLTVAVTPANAGTVTSAPAGIGCGADCSETYPLDTAVALTAAPAPGFTFSGWSTNCPAGAVTMSAGIACTATFVATPAPPAAGPGRISAGGGFSLAVNAAGVPHSWGNDSASQLGNGLPDANRSTAAPFGTITGVRSLSAGQEYHGIAVLGDGTAWAWGYRGNVDCAVGSVASVPFKVDYATDILSASAGYDHTLLLRADGRVLSFGCNHAGQLGRPGAAPPMTPLAIVPGLAPNTVAVAAGDGFSLALDANGDVWAWGRSSPADRSATGFSSTPVRVAGLSNIVAIAAAKEHALALRRDGAVLAWGSNRNGKLGDGTEVDRIAATPTLLASQITAISAGGENSLALRSDGTVLSWGINETGQLGSGSATPGFRTTPAAVIGLADIVAISSGAGRGHSLALDRHGVVWAWGANNNGQLGDGTTTARLAPVAVSGLNLN
jgi:alpha-tubulin suppressor-like RCC1 family protein